MTETKTRGYIRYEYELPEEIPASLYNLDERLVYLDSKDDEDYEDVKEYMYLLEELEVDIKSMYLSGMITNVDLPTILMRYGLD